MSDRFESAFSPGQEVLIGTNGEITARVEEVIFARGMRAPFYLVEWWHEGQLVTRRLHEADIHHQQRATPAKPGGIVWRQGRPD
jgi:hypothetical protein